eukprot:CAMPEP_0114658668 /NCGR_PEP_ID=MMETSP0191-20121206/16168_1 /TAXON_ID=126664 /ORGANISM="Sorites sp." /LENGTH=47 /DNA_ID= /DNA_START= /DNA_END= /DNA_ORIENTATION=
MMEIHLKDGNMDLEVIGLMLIGIQIQLDIVYYQMDLVIGYWIVQENL